MREKGTEGGREGESGWGREEMHESGRRGRGN
jgi:hypothetical protein